MPPVVLSLIIGVVAGSRTMTAPAATSLAALLGVMRLVDTPLAWLGSPWTAGILVALAIAELVGDQLPTTPSRTVPIQFGARLVSGALSGYAFAPAAPVLGVAAGLVGAVIGTLGGRALRARLASAFKSDRPAALIEDALAILGAVCAVLLAR